MLEKLKLEKKKDDSQIKITESVYNRQEGLLVEL